MKPFPTYKEVFELPDSVELDPIQLFVLNNDLADPEQSAFFFSELKELLTFAIKNPTLYELSTN